jgi:hypothetical protein
MELGVNARPISISPDEASGGGVVIPFIRRPPHPLSLTVSERIQTLRWADAARASGVREVRIHEPEPGDDPAVGGFVLVYEGTDLWAAWGIAARAGSFEVWRPGSGATVGCYRTLREALQAIQIVK